MSENEQDIQSLKSVIASVVELDAGALAAFTDIFHAAKVGKGQHFIEEGEIGKKVGFIVEGLLRSYYISPKGEEFNKHFFLTNTFVAPLTSLVLNVPSPVYIGALEDTRLLVADYSALSHLYDKHVILNRLGRKLVEFAWIGKERRETQLIMLSATERYQAFQKEFPGLESRIPQYHIASYLGITPVQLSRIRANLNIG